MYKFNRNINYNSSSKHCHSHANARKSIAGMATRDTTTTATMQVEHALRT